MKNKERSQFYKIPLGTILFLISAGCSHSSLKTELTPAQLEVFTLENPPEWGRTLSGDPILAGGFSGLIYLGKTDQGEFQFLTHTDRGPNGEPTTLSGQRKNLRPFLMPEFQPRWVKIETNSKNKTFRVIEEIPLSDSLGKPLTGKPQWPSEETSRSDENGVDLKGRALSADLAGIDPEGITIDSEGFYWMGEEYRPSLLKFDAKGRLLKRYIPKNSLPLAVLQKFEKKYGKGVIVEGLPEVYKYRKGNRGFEGITFSNGKIYALLQSPLELPQAVHRKVLRLLEFDPQSGTVTGEYLYPLSHEGVDKIGDLSLYSGDRQFITIEQNSKVGPSGTHLITRFQLQKKYMGSNPETVPWAELKTQEGVLSPSTVVSLAEIGYDFAEKVEGLAVISEGQIAVLNDNDFGVDGDFNLNLQKVPLTQDRKSKLGLVRWFGEAINTSSK